MKQANGRKRKEQAAKSQVGFRRHLTFFYEDFGDEIRWWSNADPGDVFDIINKHELEARIKAAAALNVRVVDHLPGFCSLMEDCPDHKGYY